MPGLVDAGRNIVSNWLSGSRQDPLALLKALQDPATQKRLAEFLKDNPKFLEEFLKNTQLGQELEHLTGKTIGGYATLPALLALLSSFFTDKPMVPILLGLAGLGIAHFFPEVREYVNAFNWFPKKEPESPGGTGSGAGTPAGGSGAGTPAGGSGAGTPAGGSGAGTPP